MSPPPNGRVGRARAILDLMRQLREREEWELAILRDEARALVAAESELLGALASEEALHGLFLEAKARRLAALRREAGQLAAECRHRQERLIDQAGRTRGAERLVAQCEEAARRARDRRELEQAVEALVVDRIRSRKPPASSG